MHINPSNQPYRKESVDRIAVLLIESVSEHVTLVGEEPPSEVFRLAVGQAKDVVRHVVFPTLIISGLRIHVCLQRQVSQGDIDTSHGDVSVNSHRERNVISQSDANRFVVLLAPLWPPNLGGLDTFKCCRMKTTCHQKQLRCRSEVLAMNTKHQPNPTSPFFPSKTISWGKGQLNARLTSETINCK